jgi:hypothetical protein
LGGFVLIGVGLDQIITGVHNIRTGTSGPSVLEYGGYWVARNYGGFSESTSQWIGAFTPVVIGLSANLLSTATIAATARTNAAAESRFWATYINSRQRSILLDRVSESRTLSEAKGIVFATRAMQNRGFLLVDASLQYRGVQGIDLLFKRTGYYAATEAKAGASLSLLRTYSGLRQASAMYNVSRLQRCALYGDRQVMMIANDLIQNSFSLYSYATFYRSRLVFELPIGWPSIPAILR